jgi:hypothetical protein
LVTKSLSGLSPATDAGPTPEVFAPRSASPIESRLGHLPQVFSPLQSITERARRASPSRPDRSPGVRSPSAHDGHPEPTRPGLASPGTLRLQAFAASWRLASPDASRPCFMPVTPMGFGALQSFSPSSSRFPLGIALPSCRSPSRFGSAPGPCLRSLGPLSGRSIFQVPPGPDALLGFCPSRVFPSPAMAPPSGRLLSSFTPAFSARRQTRGCPPESRSRESRPWALSSPPTLLGSPASSFPPGFPAVRRGLRP